MNKNETIINTIFGLLTVENQKLSEVIEIAGDILQVKPVTVNYSINQLVERGVAVKEIIDGEKVVRALETPAVETPTTETPVIESPTVVRISPAKKKVGKYGTTPQMGNDGKQFEYVRSEFDGHEGKLSPAHEAKKNDLITFKSVVREMVTNCNGIGRVAITMYQPDISKRSDGKVFYRWDNPSKTEPLIDELHAVIAPMIAMMKEQMEEGSE